MLVATMTLTWPTAPAAVATGIPAVGRARGLGRYADVALECTVCDVAAAGVQLRMPVSGSFDAQGSRPRGSAPV